MTDQAVDILFRSKIKARVHPSITHMTSGTVGKIGLRCDAEVVQYVSLANLLLVIGIKKLPGPVFCFMDLFGCFGMALDADPGYFRAGIESILQFFELAMISSSRGICRSCNQNRQNKYSAAAEYFIN